MSKSTKPREFWIIESPDGKESDYVYRHNPFPTDGGAVHVREVMPDEILQENWNAYMFGKLDRMTRALEKAKEYIRMASLYDDQFCEDERIKIQKEIEAIERGAGQKEKIMRVICPWCKKAVGEPQGKPFLMKMEDGSERWHQVFRHKAIDCNQNNFSRWTYDVHDLLVEENK